METNTLKFSYYNFIIPVEEKNTYIIYNSFNNSLIEVPWKIGGKLSNLSSDEINFLPEKLIEQLVENGNIIPEYKDELQALIKREQMARNKLSKDEISHTVIALTNSCNMQCLYCYELSTSHQDNLDVKKTKNILEKVLDKGIKHLDIRWFGGEPLLRTEMIDDLSRFMIKKCSQKNVSYSASITTNGTLLNEETWDILKRGKVKSVQITLDGAPAIHNRKRILPGKDSFELISNNLSEMPKDVFNVALRINADKEVFASLPEFFDLLYEKEIWPHRHKEIKIDLAQKFYFKDGKHENIELYYTSYEFQSVLKEFVKMKLERMNMYNKEYNRKSSKIVYKYPTPAIFFCNVVENKRNLVIDGRGALYKCYTNIGDDNFKIGSIDNFDIDMNIDKSLCDFNKSSFSDCRMCKVLPICEQNCNYTAITKFKSYTCSSWKYFMEERMKGYYLQMDEKRDENRNNR